MPYLNLNNSPLYYDTHGSGPALVLIHSGICDSRMWDDQIVDFATRYRVIRFDMRGYGKSAVSDHPYANHDDLNALLEQLHIDKAHILGCSRGGGIAFDFALTYPEKTASLIVSGGTPFGYEWGETSYEPPQWQELLQAFEQDDFERAAELDVQIWVDGPERDETAVSPTIREKVRQMDLHILRQEKARTVHEQIMEPKAATRLSHISCPTLLICGTIDDPDLVKAASRLTASIPHAQTQLISQTAHFPNLEQPTQFNQIVLDFLPS